ncbi:hypothetical protein ACTJJ0_22190 [Chitinophaga sp. 22321]|uniref:hypothetical protein n=1 Tax=Chitinophaga sp. 22321 TaxID=3453909 RepID=UPI003F838934
MNIEQAKRVPLPVILHILGLTQTQLKNTDETDVITYVCRHLESTGENATEADAVRWIIHMTGQAPRIAPVVEVEAPELNKRQYIDGIEPITNPLLINHIESKGIPLNIAQRYLKRVRVCSKDTHDFFYALGFRNESGGWAYYNPFENGFVGDMDISFIRGTDIKPEGIHIFKNDRDFMAAVIRMNNGQPLKYDALILNDIANLPQATPYIYQYGYRTAFTWMDNCQVGKAATQSLDDYFKTEDRLQHAPMNGLYRPYLGVSAWHMKELGLVSA